MIIDRFEGEIAVCECDDGSFKHIAKCDIIGDANEGDVLVCTDNGKYMVDKEKTEQRRQKILLKHRKIWKD